MTWDHPVTYPDYDMSWQKSAECRLRGADPDLFINDDDPDETHRRVRRRTAKRYCATCPVTAECLQQALDLHEVGVWGGLTDRERRHLLEESA